LLREGINAPGRQVEEHEGWKISAAVRDSTSEEGVLRQEKGGGPLTNPEEER